MYRRLEWTKIDNPSGLEQGSEIHGEGEGLLRDS
jgi:hypothetical protein